MNEKARLRKLVSEQNIERYERMLQTPLTELERTFIRRRIAEERKAVRTPAVSAGTLDLRRALARRRLHDLVAPLSIVTAGSPIWPSPFKS
jgi:hypothetical protein